MTTKQHLTHLESTGLLRLAQTQPELEYLFRHALVQDAAYESLLLADRKELHRQVAETLERLYPDRLDELASLLGQHFAKAKEVEKAINYLLRAGQRASLMSAHTEAIVHLRKGLDLLKTLPESDERTRQELALQISLGNSLLAIKGHTDLEVERAFSYALKLCQQITGATRQLMSVLYGLWLYYRVRAEHQTERELGEQLLRLAQNSNDTALLLAAHKAMGGTFFIFGEFSQAQAHLEQGMALYDLQHHRTLVAIFAEDVGLACFYEASCTSWILGYPDQSLKLIHEMIDLAKASSHSFTMAGTLGWAAIIHQMRGDTHTVQEQVEAVTTICTENGFSYWLAVGIMLNSWILTKHGQPEEGITQLQHVLAGFKASGVIVFQWYALYLLGEAYEKTGRFQEGLGVLTKALELVNNNESRVYEAELHRLKGELLLKAEDTGQNGELLAEESLSKAIEVARRQQARSLELRATMSLCRLWQAQGKMEEAQQVLAKIYGWFTEGFDTPDLKEARALLEGLS